MSDAVGELVTRVATVLRADGRGVAATQLEVLARRPASDVPVVFVVGETGRGKSALVDALVGHRPSSHAALGPTAVPIVYAHGSAAAELVDAAGAPRAVALELARVAATDAGTFASRVKISVESPVLEHLSVVDTPGAGGLDSGQAALTLQALSDADALVFVVDASAPLRASELQFLRKASARIDTVVFVVTKTDLHRGWQTIMSDDQRIVAQQAPRFADCPWVAVSSQLCLEGLDEDPEEATALREESGIAALESLLLARVSERSATLHDLNVLRAALGQLNLAERMLAQRMGAGTDDGAPADAQHRLAADRERLKELARDRSTWMQTLETEFRKLPAERQQIIGRRTIEIRRRYEEQLKQVKPADEDAMAPALVADLTALAGQVNEATITRVEMLVRSILKDLDDPGQLEHDIRELGATTLDDQLDAIHLSRSGLSHLDRLSIFSTFSAGRSMAGFASGSGLGVTASALIAPPIGLAIGLGLGGFFAFQSFRNRRREIFAHEFSSWMRDQVVYAQQTLTTSFARDSVELQTSIRGYLRDILAARESEITTVIGAAEADARKAAATRQTEAAQMRHRLQEVRAVRQRAAALIATVAPTDAARSASGRPTER